MTSENPNLSITITSPIAPRQFLHKFKVHQLFKSNWTKREIFLKLHVSTYIGINSTELFHIPRRRNDRRMKEKRRTKLTDLPTQTAAGPHRSPPPLEPFCASLYNSSFTEIVRESSTLAKKRYPTLSAPHFYIPLSVQSLPHLNHCTDMRENWDPRRGQKTLQGRRLQPVQVAQKLRYPEQNILSSAWRSFLRSADSGPIHHTVGVTNLLA
jgi:hypothetical protein